MCLLLLCLFLNAQLLLLQVQSKSKKWKGSWIFSFKGHGQYAAQSKQRDNGVNWGFVWFPHKVSGWNACRCSSSVKGSRWSGSSCTGWFVNGSERVREHNLNEKVTMGEGSFDGNTYWDVCVCVGVCERAAGQIAGLFLVSQVEVLLHHQGLKPINFWATLCFLITFPLLVSLISILFIFSSVLCRRIRTVQWKISQTHLQGKAVSLQLFNLEILWHECRHLICEITWENLFLGPSDWSSWNHI